MELNQNEVSVPQPILQLNRREYLEEKFLYLAHQSTYWVTSLEVRQMGGREILPEGYSRSATFRSPDHLLG